MSEYIKKEDAIDAVGRVDKAHMKLKGTPMLGACALLDEINDIPSADVVEVVRCKDCKHHEELLNNNDGNVLCWVHDIDVIVDENGYCSYGERKEQENE